MNRSALALAAALVFVTACVHPSQNMYDSKEAGVSRAVELATILSARPVDIKNKDTGVGMLGGGIAGGAAGSGGGNGWATAGAALVGAVAGTLIEQHVSQRDGIEYTLRTDQGEIKTIVQENVEGEPIFKKGDRVMMQACDAGDHYRRCASGRDGYQRLLPTDIPRQAPQPVKKHKAHHTPQVVDDIDMPDTGDEKGN